MILLLTGLLPVGGGWPPLGDESKNQSCSSSCCFFAFCFAIRSRNAFSSASAAAWLALTGALLALLPPPCAATGRLPPAAATHFAPCVAHSFWNSSGDIRSFVFFFVLSSNYIFRCVVSETGCTRSSRVFWQFCCFFLLSLQNVIVV